MSIAFTGLQRIEFFKRFYPIDQIVCDDIKTGDALPSAQVLVIVNRNGKNSLDKFHWGLVPYWAKNPSTGKGLINARAETVAEKPSFRRAFKTQRCLIPARGFYEWTKLGNAKKAVYIELPGAVPFAFAGLWDGRKTAQVEHKSCAMITTRASISIRSVHHRMPVVLKPEAYNDWLDPLNQEINGIKLILKTSIHTEFICDMRETSAKSRHRQLSLLD